MELNHGAVSRRVDPSAPGKVRGSTARREFVEVSALPVAKTASTTVIELTSATGNRLTVRLSEAVDVRQLLSEFQARQ